MNIGVSDNGYIEILELEQLRAYELVEKWKNVKSSNKELVSTMTAIDNYVNGKRYASEGDRESEYGKMMTEDLKQQIMVDLLKRSNTSPITR